MRATVYMNSTSCLALFLCPNDANSMNGLEKEFPFCSNPDCELYVRAGDSGVIGSGNWAQFPDGRIVGRSIYSGVYMCDVCGREWLPVLAIRSGIAL
jgi:hypothetical protein